MIYRVFLLLLLRKHPELETIDNLVGVVKQCIDIFALIWIESYSCSWCRFIWPSVIATINIGDLMKVLSTMVVYALFKSPKNN